MWTLGGAALGVVTSETSLGAARVKGEVNVDMTILRKGTNSLYGAATRSRQMSVMVVKFQAVSEGTTEYAT